MSETAKLILGGEEFEFPIIEGAENEKGIDIAKLRGTTGYITIDPGFKNTGSCKSAITYLDGEKGILRYRGHSIESLAENATFLESSYLVVFGNLPSKSELIKFENDIRSHTMIDEEMKNIIDGFPKSAHPMGVLSSLTSALTAFNPKSLDINSETQMYNAVCKMLGKFLVLASWVYKKHVGHPLNYYDNSKGYVENLPKKGLTRGTYLVYSSRHVSVIKDGVVLDWTALKEARSKRTVVCYQLLKTGESL